MAEVFNEDVVRFHNRINRYIEEMYKSSSSGNSLLNEFDMERLRSYLTALRFLEAVTVALPELDQPETHPKPYTLRENPEQKDVENEMINDVINMLINMRDELDNSQSARLSSNFIKFDSKRLLASVGRIEMYLSEYADKATPLDLPESSPRAEMSGAGRTGT